MAFSELLILKSLSSANTGPMHLIVAACLALNFPQVTFSLRLPAELQDPIWGLLFTYRKLKYFSVTVVTELTCFWYTEGRN